MADASDHDQGGRPLRPEEKRILGLLGLPTLALALSLTVVSTYLPVVAKDVLGSTVFIGLIIGLEGLMALWVPLVVGTWSDRLRTRLGGRLPFVIVAAPVAATTLGVIGFVRSGGLIALVGGLFFMSYFVAYEPYRALYPDALPEAVAGRAQSTQAVFRGVGTALALIGGGLLVTLGKPVPFIVGGALLGVTLLAFSVAIARRGPPDAHGGGNDEKHATLRDGVVDLWVLVRASAELRAFFFANALWELSLAALKTFIILYLTRGLGLSTTMSALAVGAAALFILAGAVGSGKLGDRIGRVRVLSIALPVYGAGLLVPLIFSAPLAVAVVAPVAALGGGVVMSLPYAVLTPLMPDDRHGALTGFYTFSRGIGIALGPLLAGIAVRTLQQPFSATQGYQAMWGVCSAAIFASLLFLPRLRGRQEREAGR